LLLINSSCSQVFDRDVHISNPRNCLPEYETYGYSISATAEPDIIFNIPKEVVDSWKPMLSQTEQEKIGATLISSVVYFADNLWLTARAPGQALVRYKPNKDLIFYTIEADDDYICVPESLFVSSKSGLWGIGNLAVGPWRSDPQRTPESATVLSKYDPQGDRFVPVVDLNGELISDAGPVDLVEDSQGFFWITLQNKTVARFDPVSRKAEIVLDQNDGYLFEQVAVDSDDKIWFSAVSTHPVTQINGKEPYELVFYDPKADEIVSYGVPPAWPDSNSPFKPYVDLNGNIWAPGGWLKKSKSGNVEWFRLIEQPQFLVLNLSPPDITVPKYDMALPTLILETSDGSMWFENRGLLRLDPETGSWCRISHYDISPQVIEDDSGNIWLAQDNQLYKTP
jgi:hypothetical protein